MVLQAAGVGVKPRLLDVFCGAGGAAVGYAQAGFEVVGVDIAAQPNYPFMFIRADALEVFDPGFWVLGGIKDFDAIHASPPCQEWTAYRRKGHGVGDGYDNLIAETRELLDATGLPYVIENIKGAPLHDPVMLCGSSFHLDVRRHRYFETNWPFLALPCQHDWQRGRRLYKPASNRENYRDTVEVGVWRIPLETQKRAMGVDWDCTLEELSEMVPPAYTEHIGQQLRQAPGRLTA
jgi:DNA (cytosine-5)-methyltransferase 1